MKLKHLRPVLIAELAVRSLTTSVVSIIRSDSADVLNPREAGLPTGATNELIARIKFCLKLIDSAFRVGRCSNEIVFLASNY